jgi:hypothetical protein
MSVLSSRPDGVGFHYGFAPGDRRQINVRYETHEHGGSKLSGWIAYVDGIAFQDVHHSMADAEKTAIDFIKCNPEEDETNGQTQSGIPNQVSVGR